MDTKKILEDLLEKADKREVVRRPDWGFTHKEWNRRKKRRKIAQKARRINRRKGK